MLTVLCYVSYSKGEQLENERQPTAPKPGKVVIMRDPDSEPLNHTSIVRAKTAKEMY